MTATRLWILWLLATLAGGVVLSAGMLYGGSVRPSFLIGKTTSGHHQIELACGACHTEPFAGKAAIEASCQGCHAADLKASKDSHPAKKFTDPRNADRLEKLDAISCTTCHTEHRPEITQAMGVTLPGDYCALCHQDVGKNRPSHDGLAFTTCADAGCHNYHDNRALYEDFLEKHADSPKTTASPVVKLRAEPPERELAAEPITDAAMADAPPGKESDATITEDWLTTRHAASGVNCSGCHAVGAETPEAIAAGWVDKPGHAQCATCHEAEQRTFTEGRHGMRLAKGLYSERAGLGGLFSDKPLTPMRPQLARLPMTVKSHGAEIGCTTCHGAHAFDTVKPQVDACLSCHDDEHSKSYIGSPHHKLWQAEAEGAAPKGSGVSCATCHLPRETLEDPDTYEERLLVNHNQNVNLRPNEKMIRSVCMDCHGLGFAIDALADSALVRSNFAGSPSTRVESITWVMKRLREREGKADKPPGAD